jgi:uncharacterized protein (TIGR03435 family)
VGIACAQDVLDVAAVKPHPSNVTCSRTQVFASGRLEVGCFTLELIIREGLNLLPDQLSGGPKWVRNDLWDITAKAVNTGGKPEAEIYREMLRALALERFHAKLRSGKRLVKGFALTIASEGKLGPELKPSGAEPHSFEVKRGPSLVAHNIRMGELAEWLRWAAGAGRSVIDRTGLSGAYDVSLKWSPLHSDQITDKQIDKDQPAIFDALRQQLGLKLIPAQVEQDVYEIEFAERPEPN